MKEKLLVGVSDWLCRCIVTVCMLPLGPASARPKLRALIARELLSKEGTVRRKVPVFVRLAGAGAVVAVVVAPAELTPAGVATFTLAAAAVNVCPGRCSPGWMGMDSDL